MIKKFNKGDYGYLVLVKDFHVYYKCKEHIADLIDKGDMTSTRIKKHNHIFGDKGDKIYMDENKKSKKGGNIQ